jgi:hypothetical protein
LPKSFWALAEADAFAGLGVDHEHVAFELAGDDADEGDAVAVRGSMFAWILKTKPLKRGWSGWMIAIAGAGALAGCECSRKPSSRSCTPKLFMALPKKTGVVVPAESTAGASKSGPAPSSMLDLVAGRSEDASGSLLADGGIVEPDLTGAREHAADGALEEVDLPASSGRRRP